MLYLSRKGRKVKPVKEYMYSEDRSARAIIQEDQKAPNPRLDLDNLCLLETWDLVSPTPDYGAIHKMRASVVHILGRDSADEWRAYWCDRKGRSHYKNDEYTVNLLSRTLRAFGDSPYVAFLAKGEYGRLVIADKWSEGQIVGIGYVLPLVVKVSEEDLRQYMQDEIDKYNLWARGDVYQYAIEYLADCPCRGTHAGCNGSLWVEADRGDGIYGKEVVMGQAATAWSEMEISA